MTIAIDAREMIGQRDGRGRYLVGLLGAFADVAPKETRYLLYSHRAPDRDVTIPANAELVCLPRFALFGYQSFWMSHDAHRRGADVLLSVTGFPPAIFSTIPTAIVVHDLAVWRYASYPANIWFIEKLGLPLALKRAQRIFTVSWHTAQELIDLFRIQPDRLVTAYGGVGERFRVFDERDRADQVELERVRTKYHLTGEFILSVSTLQPRKNLLRLVRGYHALSDALRTRYSLIVVGKKGWQYDEIFAQVRGLGEEGHIQFLGYVPDEDLPALYNLAHLAIYPSIYEGFGLPALEALACGTPLVASQTSSIPEVVGDAALAIDPLSVGSITDGLTKGLTDQSLRQRLKKIGPEQAHRFSWHATARTVLYGLEQMTNFGAGPAAQKGRQ